MDAIFVFSSPSCTYKRILREFDFLTLKANRYEYDANLTDIISIACSMVSGDSRKVLRSVCIMVVLGCHETFLFCNKLVVFIHFVFFRRTHYKESKAEETEMDFRGVKGESRRSQLGIVLGGYKKSPAIGHFRQLFFDPS